MIERDRARLASLRAGDGAHRDIERGKLGRWRLAGRVAGIARAERRRVSTRPNTLVWPWGNHG